VNADTFVRGLELPLDEIPICLACLSFVAFAIDGGDEREIARRTRQMTPDLWEEGLALPARGAVERAHRAGVPGAADALADLELHGSRSATAHAIVRRLGEDLSALARGERRQMGSDRFEEG
jgi:hypothetical protein